MHRFELELIILGYLEANPYTSTNEIRSHAISQLRTREIEITSEVYLLINTIIWDYIADRILTPGIDMSNYDLPYIHVSNVDKLKNKLNENKDL